MPVSLLASNTKDTVLFCKLSFPLRNFNLTVKLQMATKNMVIVCVSWSVCQHRESS